MKFKDLHGNDASGTVHCQGALAGTVWVHDGNRWFLVHATKRAEVEYEMPVHLPPVPKPIEKIAEDIVEAYRESRRVFASLGVTPVDPDLDWAVAILEAAEKARKSRLPFINSHSLLLGKNLAGDFYSSHHQIKSAVADKRLKELASEEE